MKHIGILAHSFEGATLCFRTACLEGVQRLGAHMHPEITMTCSPMALMVDAWDRGDHAQLRNFFMEDAKRLAAAGCDFSSCLTIRRISRWNRPASHFQSRRSTLAKWWPSKRDAMGGPRLAYWAPTGP
jgi:hypothetical protein